LGEIQQTGLEYWYTLKGDKPAYAAATIKLLEDAGLDAALRHGTSAALEFDRSHPKFHLHFLDHGAFFLGLTALYLHSTGGISHRRLAAMCGTSRLLSNGRASAILLNLWSKGFLRRADERMADRTVLYTPTTLLTQSFRARIRIEIECIAIVDPAVHALLARWDEPGVFECYMATAGRMLLAGATLKEADSFHAISAYRASLLMLNMLMAAADDGGPFPPVGEAPVSVSALATRCGVARSHVRRVLALCETLGLLRRSAEDRGVTLLPALRDMMRTYYAIVFVSELAIVHQTLLALRAAPEHPAGPSEHAVHADIQQAVAGLY
jgi:hypothetical protein